jgi:hypothetical protein
MRRKLVYTNTADQQYEELLNDPAKKGVLKQIQKTLGFLETNVRHPSLQTHEYSSLQGFKGEKVWEAYAQQDTSAAYRVFFHYGPDITKKGKRIPVITVVAITPHP